MPNKPVTAAMAADAMETSPSKTAQVRVHLQSRSEDIQIPDSGPILVSTGKQQACPIRSDGSWQRREVNASLIDR